MPKGMRLKWYHPNGVRKAVSSQEFAFRGICQKLLLASSLLNVVAPASCARVLSTFSRGCVSLCMLSLSRQKSTQMRISPDRLGTTAISAYQGMGFVDRDMTPSDSMRQALSRPSYSAPVSWFALNQLFQYTQRLHSWEPKEVLVELLDDIDSLL